MLQSEAARLPTDSRNPLSRLDRFSVEVFPVDLAQGATPPERQQVVAGLTDTTPSPLVLANPVKDLIESVQFERRSRPYLRVPVEIEVAVGRASAKFRASYSECLSLGP
jgi:hypothetical protein